MKYYTYMNIVTGSNKIHGRGRNATGVVAFHLAFVSAFILALFITFVVAKVCFADSTTTSPFQIDYYCYPYTQSFVEGGYYMPTYPYCYYGGFNIAGPYRFAGIFKGVVGSSTMINAHGMSSYQQLQGQNDVFNSPQQGDKFFATVWATTDDPTSINDYLSFVEDGSKPSPTPNYGILNWRWGIAPATTTATSTCTQNCESNVLFIPGIESSRLYAKIGGAENKLWEPGVLSHQTDVQALYLNSDGTSKNQVYTKANDVLDRVTSTFLGRTVSDIDVYSSFLHQLSSMKVSSTIQDFATYPYDWRMSPDDVVNNGTLYNDGTTHYIEQALVTLAATSKTGKVTIVAHSNGGLVAKELMIKLAADGKANLVDKLILVAVPQLGTPKAVASILHGDFQSIPLSSGLVVSRATARGLAVNMPDAFDLLPSSTYFSRVATPVADLTSSPLLKTASGLQTNTISNVYDLRDFMTDSGYRQNPVFNDTETPAVTPTSLFVKALNLHVVLDSWQPPTGVQVIQIAGWGIDTPAEVVYSDKNVTFCSQLTCASTSTVRHTVKMTEDGDDTVVDASAVNPNWQIYYFNLYKYGFDSKKTFTHSNILEADPVEKLFSLIMASSSANLLSEYISTSQPAPVSAQKSLRLRVLSPVSLDAYDSFGNHTGVAQNPNPDSDDILIQEQIPGSYYQQYGEGQYIGLPDDGSNYTVKLKGLDTGTFTFEVTPVVAGIEGTSTTFADVPVTASSTASIAINSNAVNSTSIALDENGDGKVDATIASSSQMQSPYAYAQLIKSSIALMDIGDPLQRQLQAKLTNMLYLLNKLDQWNTDDDDPRDVAKTDKVAVRVVRKIGNIENYIQQVLGKSASRKPKDNKLSTNQASTIVNMLDKLKMLVNQKV